MADRLGSRHFPAVESPDVAVNQACAWAIGRVGGHLRVDPAGRSDRWVGEDVTGLIEDAREWYRIRRSDLLDPEEFLGRLVGLLIGARVDGIGGRLELEPMLPEGWRGIKVRRLRAHRTLIDLEVRRRAEWVTIRLAVMFGPPIAVTVALPEDESVARVTVDEIAVEGPRATFTAGGEHEVTLYLGVSG